MADGGRIGQRAGADRPALDALDLLHGVAEPGQRHRDELVDDLEVAAAGQLLELDEGEVGLDAGRLAVHDEADGAGWRDHRDLGVAEAVRLAQRQCVIPGGDGGLGERRIGHQRRFQRHRRHRQLLVAGALAAGGAAMVADHPQHLGAVGGKAGEGTHLAGHLRRGGVGGAGHQRRYRGAQVAGCVGVVGEAGGHQVAADVGVAEAEGAELPGEAGDPLRRVLRHRHRDLEDDGPQPHRVGERRNIELAVVALERQKVERGEIARGIVEEHIFGARIGRIDAAAGRAGVPVVDGGVVLQAGIGAAPGGLGDLPPQGARRQPPGDAPVGAARQRPLAVLLHLLQEGVGHPHRVVGVLAGDGAVGLGIPVGIEHREGGGIALARQLDGPLDRRLRKHRPPGAADRLAQRRVVLGIEAAVVAAVELVAGTGHRLEVGAGELRAGDHRRHLLLLAHLPADELLDVGMVDVDHHHLRRPPGGAAGLDSAGGAVADLEEAHQAGRAAAAGQRLVLGAQPREVGAGAGAVLEQPRFAHPQVHDAAVVDQVVGDALDEAGVRLRPLVGGGRGVHLPGPVLRPEVALRRTVDAIGPVQAGVEPLRRVGGRLLRRQHVAQLVVEGAGAGLVVEVAALPAPVGPGAGHPVEDLAGTALAPAAHLRRYQRQRLLVRSPPPQPRRHALFRHRHQPHRNARLAEVLLGEDIAGDLRPRRRHLDVVLAEDDGAVGIADLAARGAEGDAVVGVCIGDREQARNLHGMKPPDCRCRTGRKGRNLPPPGLARYVLPRGKTHYILW